MTTSFPFLKISRDFGLPYGDTLRLVVWVEQTAKIPGFSAAHDFNASMDGHRGALLRAILAAIEAERARRHGVWLMDSGIPLKSGEGLTINWSPATPQPVEVIIHKVPRKDEP